MNLTLHNPHSVLAVLETRPRDVLQLSLPAASAQANADPSDPWVKVARLARDYKIPMQAPVKGGGGGGQRSPSGPPKGDVGGRQGFASALIKERPSRPIEELFQDAREQKSGKGLWLALDSLQDPQNVGAIFRTAGFFGVQGIIITQERSAPLSAAAYDVASGGLEYVPFCQQVNLQRAFESAKEEGLWILGTSEHAKQDLKKVERDRPWLLVLGNEEKGMRRLTEEACDVLCGIQALGKVTSLNVATAAGICISHLT